MTATKTGAGGSTPESTKASAPKTIDDRTRLITIASVIALAGNLVLAAAKISVGLLFNSLAVVGDGIDSSTDVVIALMSLFVARIIARPADAEHPWGHTRAETIATTALSFILFFAAIQLMKSGIDSIIHPVADKALPELPALVVTVCSIAGKLLLALSQFALGKKAGSAMLRANGENMRNDVIISTAVLVGVAIAVFLKFPLADSITGILVGLWVLKSAFGIFRESNLELMDGVEDKEKYRVIFEAVKSVPGVKRPHRARMRRIASKWDIDLDIEVDGSTSVREAHRLAELVEEAIKEKLDDVYDIMVHVEPEGETEHHERGSEAFGLCEKDVQGA